MCPFELSTNFEQNPRVALFAFLVRFQKYVPKVIIDFSLADNDASVANALELNDKAAMKELKEPPFKGRSLAGKFYRNKAPSPSPIPLFEKFVVELLR